ncbi:hypothetical protein, conserved [Babesia bigemina]|uniref:C3H1-type domain-containing protein n=1 Tax=Babesia bigemina TaxID=5866 RepID=A0A061BKJ5_BABBI|nr:hypothetical protein, conserved [Babesia bigemina]CDR71957.1 hypothetical protein, conserved [Babesia bigemina]|eukprot:XP_012770899.1 hypothetical protein, conserved [Babesia bigemina]
MAFLSGVLSAVKDENEVTTYDIHLDKRLEKVLEEVNKKIGSGRAGLAASVDAVKGWLEGYEGEVREKTEALKRNVKLLNNSITDTYIAKFDSYHDRSLEQIHDVFIKCTADLFGTMSVLKNNSQGYMSLDYGLKTKLEVPLGKIDEALKMLKNTANDSDLFRQAKRVDDQLVTQRDHVVNSIETGSNVLLSTFAEEFNRVVGVINRLNDDKRTYFQGIHETLTDAERLIQNFDTTYKYKIVEQFENLKIHLANIDADRGDKGNSKLKNHFEALKTDVQKIGNDVSVENIKLNEWKDAALTAVHKAQATIGELVNVLNGEEVGKLPKKKAAVTTAAEEIYQQNEHLWASIMQAGRALEEKVSAAQESLKTLDEAVSKDLMELKFGINERMGWYVDKLKEAANKADQAANGPSASSVKPDDILNLLDGELKKLYSAAKEKSLTMNGKDLGSDDLNEALQAFHDSLKLTNKKTNKSITIIDAIREDLQNAVAAALKKAHQKVDSVKHLMTHYRMHLNDSGAIKSAIRSIQTDVKKALDEAPQIGHLLYTSNNLTSKFDAFIHAIQQLAQNGAPHSQNKNSVSHYLADLDQMIVTADEEGYTLTADYSSDLNLSIKRLAKIYDKLKDLQKNIAAVTKSTDAGEIDEIISHLQGLPALVDKATLQTKQNIYDLYNNLVDKISFMRQSFELADNAMTNAISSLQQTFNSVRENAKSGVENLRNYLIDLAVKSFSTLTTEVRMLFAERHKADLKALKISVESQIPVVIEILHYDKRNGLKGLMKRMNNHETTFQKMSTLFQQRSVDDFKHMALQFKMLVGSYLEYTEEQAMTPGKSPQPTDQSEKVRHLKDAVDSLLHYLKQNGHLTRQYMFDHHFDDLLTSLNSLVTSLSPSFTSPSPLLGPLKTGLSKFAEQLGHAYVNRYSGRKMGKLLEVKPSSENQKPAKTQLSDTSTDNYDLTPEGRNCAKVCLTIVEMVSEDLKYLREQCETKWAPKKIYSGSSLGSFLTKCGYRVAIKDTDQNGELQCKSSMKGEQVHERLMTKKYSSDSEIKHLKECESNKDQETGKPKKSSNFHIFDLINCLHHHLETYYSINHMATFASKKQPCSVYEMLCWMSGLPHNNVYFDLTTDGFDALFDKREKKEDDSIEFEYITVEDKTPNSLTAYPLMIRRGDITNAIVHLTSYAPTVLTTILGTGDEFTTYAVDFRTNHLKFSYPSRAEDCLHTLLDILRRIFPPLKFLHSQCDTLTSEHGWYRCKYGKDVQSAKLPCTKHSKTETECQPRSPLMSFLGDCLPGHLPHQLTSVGCKAECKSCPKATPGQPCLTPLGFRGFSGSTKLGKELGNVLTKFFSNGIATPLLSFVPKPPSSLPEHFGFALYLVKGWGEGSTRTGKNGTQGYVEEAMKSQSIKLYSDTTPLTDALRTAYGDARGSHQDKDHLPLYADLASLSMVKSCVDKVNHVYCAPYLSSVCGDSYGYFAKKHSDHYLSWAIYLPWTFWDLLNNLYNAFCSINCQDWGCRGCLRGDKCKKGQHGVVDKDKPSAICQCPSIVDCKGVAPTLYQYGFVFGEASTLNDKDAPKKCSDFCSQLKNVLKSKYFEKLFDECDMFLWRIREPFSYLVLSLWLLSFLYLLHIMVIRLDLLHIKSHLHSPSSHRIAAQSLLAAARVNKLGKMFYLQP